MTRINPCHPVRLVDQFLIAEYKELPRVFTFARPVTNAPREYCLGAGHMTFFYDKTLFLSRRQGDLIAECLSRGFDVKYRVPPEPIPKLDLDWTPDARAIALNRGRLYMRFMLKPGFYRYRGRPVDPGFYGTREDIEADIERFGFSWSDIA